MSFNVPDIGDATYDSQASLDSGDLAILAAAAALTGVQSGCAVTAQATPNITVAVAAGVVRIGGRKVNVTGGNVTITTANATNARVDLITVDTTGTLAVVTGTPAPVTDSSEPGYPAIPASRVVLAAIYIPAASISVVANQITDKRVGIQDPGYELVDWYGAVGTTDSSTPTVDASAAIIAAEAALPSYGGWVRFGAKRYGIASSIGPTKDNVRFTGAGRTATEIFRLGDIISLDVIGAHPATTTTVKRTTFTVEHMAFHGVSDTYVQPVTRWAYSSENLVFAVDFYGGGGSLVDTTEFWDTYFYGCRFQDAGRSPTAGPAVYIRSSMGAASGIGHSTDNTNNIWFTNCVWETNWSGDVWFVGRQANGAGPVNKCYVVSAKLETLVVGAPSILVQQGYAVNLTNVQLTWGPTFKTGVSTPQNMVQINDSMEVRFYGLSGEAGGATGSTIRTLLMLNGANQDIHIDAVVGAWQTAFKPSQSLMDFLNSNIRVRIGAHGHNDPSNTTPLITGWMNSESPSSDPISRGLNADVTTTSTAIADVGALVFDTYPGNYIIEVEGLHSSSSTTQGPRLAVGGTATVNNIDGFLIQNPTLTTTTATLITALNTLYGANLTVAGDKPFSLQVRVSIATHGTFGLRWASSQGSTTATLRRGTLARLTRVG